MALKACVFSMMLFQIKRQDTKRSIKTVASEQPGPSNRKSETPPLPPIKSDSPKSEAKSKTPSRQSQSRRETPILPPIARKDSRTASRREQSRASTRSADGIQPPKDMREFDPDLGVGEVEPSDKPRPSRAAETHATKEPQPVEQKQVRQVQAVPTERKDTSPETKHKSPEKEKSPTKEKSPEQRKERSPEIQRTPEIPRTPDRSTVVPVVAAASTSSQRAKSRSRSRSRSRERSYRKSRRRSSSRSRSNSRRRTRRSKSRKRYRSYSSSSSPRRHRRYSSSPGRRHRSRGRSRSKRGSFEYDFHRARSIVRSLSRMDTFSRPRHRSPSVEYRIVGGHGGGYWPNTGPELSRKKKRIIIVQNGTSGHKTKRRNHSSTDSDISVIVTNVKHKSKGRKEKIRNVSESEESDSESRSRSRKYKRNRKSKGRKDASDSDDYDNETSKRTLKQSKKKNIRFDLKNIPGKHNLGKKAKKATFEPNTDSEPDVDENENIPKIHHKATAVAAKSKVPVEESQEDAHTAFRLPTPDSPITPESMVGRNETPLSPQVQASIFPPAKGNPNKQKIKTRDDEKDMQEALEQLDKLTDFELNQLKGGNQRKLPPNVNTDMKKKIFSKQFQENINTFLES